MLFNRQQDPIAAVTTGAYLVDAGPGSGKTRVVTERTRRLIVSGVDPKDILLLTFTVNAAEEMALRVKEATGVRLPWACNFHRLCTKLLRMFPQFGYPDGFSILDKPGSERLAADVVSYFDPEADVKFFAKKVLDQVDQARQAKLWSGMADRTLDGHRFDQVVLMATEYESRLEQNRQLDFDLIQYKVAFALRENPRLAKRVSTKWKYIMVDEFQDTDAVQMEILRLLGSHHGNVMCVGDTDQGIFAFRGAVPENMKIFVNMFDAQVLPLTMNYRSRAEILKCANAVISENKARFPKTLESVRGEGGTARIRNYQSSRAEAEGVAREIAGLLRSGEDPEEIAILYRIGSLSRVMEEALANAGVLNRVVGALPFWQRREVQDVIAWAKVLLRRADLDAYRRVTKAPPVGLGNAAWERVAQAAHPEDGIEAEAKAKKKLPAFFRALKAARAFGEDMESLKILLEVSGYLRYLHDSCDTPDEWEQRLANVQETLDAMTEFGGITAFLDDFILGLPVEHDRRKQRAVTMTTVHGAKGLEWKHVYVIGMADGVFPSHHAIDAGVKALEEERRLLFVALTRAKDCINMSWPQILMRETQATMVTQSRFFDHMPWVRPERCLERADRVA